MIIYPDNMIPLSTDKADIIDPESFATLPLVFQERVRRSPNKTAYWQFDQQQAQWKQYSWRQLRHTVARWCSAFSKEQLSAGARVMIQMSNSMEWIAFDQSALSHSLIIVPVYIDDRPDNIAYILEHTESELLLVESYQQWLALKDDVENAGSLKRVVIVNRTQGINHLDSRVVWLDQWLDDCIVDMTHTSISSSDQSADQLATIVYTSGTTGRPKGVMLSHRNILGNAYAGLQSIMVYPDDRFLSFLPLSHMFERTVGYYLSMMAGAEVVFNRSIADLAEDMLHIKPSVVVSVPRIFERVQSKIQSQLEQEAVIKRKLFDLTVEIGWKRFQFQQNRQPWRISLWLWPLLNRLVARKVISKFGGNLRLAICGGARLSPDISRLFTGLGLNILQGYGLTESSPVISVNTLTKNKPDSIGLAYRGVEVCLGEDDELLVRSDFTMLQYWKNHEATAKAIDQNGWLHTGDIARVDEDGYIYITGRIKEIIVLGNGEKVPPVDMESAIAADPLFEQVMVVGEARAYLTALLVLNHDVWLSVAKKLGVDPNASHVLQSQLVLTFLLERIVQRLTLFPGYAFIRYVTPMLQPWTIEDGLITPTLKLKRPVVAKRFVLEIERMYASK